MLYLHNSLLLYYDSNLIFLLYDTVDRILVIHYKLHINSL